MHKGTPRPDSDRTGLGAGISDYISVVAVPASGVRSSAQQRPVQGTRTAMYELVARPGFLEALREATSRHGIVLIFDAVGTEPGEDPGHEGVVDAADQIGA